VFVRTPLLGRYHQGRMPRRLSARSSGVVENCGVWQPKHMLLYKYRSITGEAFRYTQDIFINRRLFLPKGSFLNDPNEGVVVIDVQNEWRHYANWLFLRNRQNAVRLCSFSASSRNTVLWSHYAAEHRGIAIEFDSDKITWTDGQFGQVKYADIVPQLPHNSIDQFTEAYLCKSNDWAYECEWRFVTAKDTPFQNFPSDCIRRILLGWRVTTADEEIIQFWSRSLSAAITIPLVRMKLTPLEYVLYEESEMSGKMERIQTA
jgi:hypothetical protein